MGGQADTPSWTPQISWAAGGPDTIRTCDLRQEDWGLAAIPAIETEPRRYRLGSDPDDVHLREIGEVIDPRREDAAVLDQLQRTLGSMGFAAQYQQDPVPPDGNAIHRDWLRYYDTAPNRFDLVMVSWDTASTLGEASDYSVGTVWVLIGLRADPLSREPNQ
jgi:hypothetical protein